MEQHTPRPFAPELPEESTETNHSLTTAQRINNLVASVDELITEGTRIKDCVVGGAMNVLELWQDGHWKGISLLSVDITEGTGGEAIPGDHSYVTLQRNTNGRSKITIESTMFDNAGNDYESSNSFELSPYRQDINHEASGFLYDHGQQRPYASPVTDDQGNLRQSVDITLAAVEQTVSAIVHHARESAAKASTPVAFPDEPETSVPATSRPSLGDMPPWLEQPVTRALQIRSIMQTAEKFAAEHETTDGYLLDDGLYSFKYRQDDRWQHAQIHSVTMNGLDLNSERDFISEADETRMQFSRSRGGTFCITVDMKRADAQGNIRKGRDHYVFSQQRNHIEHTGTGFSFDFNTAAYCHNKDITDQAKLSDELRQILDATQDMLEAMVEDLQEEDEAQALASPLQHF